MARYCLSLGIQYFRQIQLQKSPLPILFAKFVRPLDSFISKNEGMIEH
jgi:hypothetical protein